MPSISCRAIICTLSFRDSKAAIFSAVARRLRKLIEDFLNAATLFKGWISDHTPTRNSNSVSDSGLKRVSYMREIFVFVRGSQIKRIEPFVS